MPVLSFNDIQTAANKTFDPVQVTVPAESGKGKETLIFDSVLVVPRHKRKAYSEALKLEKRAEALFESQKDLPEDEQADVDAIGLLTEAIKESFKAVAREPRHFDRLNDVASAHDPEDPEATKFWREFFATYTAEVEAEKV